MRKTVIPFVIFVVILALWLGITLTGRIGKTKVSVSYAPLDSTISVDGKVIHGHTVYVSRGNHRFVASFRDFAPDKKYVDVQHPTTVTLYPTPVSEAAFAFLKNNPQIEQQREKFSGPIATSTAQTIASKYPFLNQLPVVGTQGFEIYQAAPRRSSDKNNTIALSVAADTPANRQRAVQFIRNELGVDPSTIEIDFGGPVNVFTNIGGGND